MALQCIRTGEETKLLPEAPVLAAKPAADDSVCSQCQAAWQRVDMEAFTCRNTGSGLSFPGPYQ